MVIDVSAQDILKETRCWNCFYRRNGYYCHRYVAGVSILFTMTQTWRVVVTSITQQCHKDGPDLFMVWGDLEESYRADG